VPGLRVAAVTLKPVGFEPTIPAVERPQIHALDHAATGAGSENGYQEHFLGVEAAGT
jgi:hypothetical protein